MFLQLSAILGTARATLGERVDTPYGWGVLRAYHTASDTYVVDLGKRVTAPAAASVFTSGGNRPKQE